MHIDNNFTPLSIQTVVIKFKIICLSRFELIIKRIIYYLYAFNNYAMIIAETFSKFIIKYQIILWML